MSVGATGWLTGTRGPRAHQMIRISTIFVAICMILIAASLGMVLYALVGLKVSESAIVALAAFTFLILYNAVSMRLKDRSDVGVQIADLSRGTADLARQVAELGRRVAAAEARVATSDSGMNSRVDPLAGEINELSTMLRQLALSVAAHDDALEALATTAPNHPATERAVDRMPPAGAVAAAAPVNAEPASATAVPASEQKPDKASAADAPLVPANAAMVKTIADALEANRIDLYLQPMVTLPQRKVRYYEITTRLRDEADKLIPAADFIGVAEQAELMAQIDNAVMLRSVQVLRRLLVRNKDVGVFCNISAATLRDTAIFAQCLDFLEANRALASSFILEFKQSTFRNPGPLESEHLAALAQRGFRFSMDNLTDLRIEPRDLADRGVRFIKVPAPLLLDQNRISTSDIHPADLSDLLGRFGIDLIAEKIEGERSVVDLLDYDVRYGQGFLFAAPRPLRADAGPGGVSETVNGAQPDPVRPAGGPDLPAGPGAMAAARPSPARTEPSGRLVGTAALVRRAASPT